jgi:NAD(P)-dependent dehydrogenase (short-subunit alcohol dehydrogenase family)
MASVAGLKGGTPHLLYPTSKGAVVNMTRAMAAHHAKDGVRVNCVCPGMVYTPMMYAGGMSEEARESRKNRSLLKTEGNGWDVGSAVRFLSGPESRWITGLIMPVDAGATAAVGTELPKNASVNP